MIRFWTLYYNVFKPKTYTSIHSTPAYIWNKIHKDKDYSLLLTQKIKIPIDLLNENILVDSWEQIYNEYIQEFPPVDYLKEMKIRKEITLMRYKAIRYNLRHLNTLAVLEELKLNNNANKGNEIDYMKNVTLIERHLKIKINYLKISIFEYNNYLRVLSE